MGQPCTRSDREERSNQFAEVESVAMRYLKQPHTIPKALSVFSLRPQLLIWNFPSGSSYRSWTIYDFWEGRTCEPRSLVRQITWDRPADAARFFDPLVGLSQGWHLQPTIEVRDRPLNSEDVEKRLRALHALSFPVFIARGLYVGSVESNGIELLSYGGPRLNWVNDGPTQWKPLADWVSEMRAWLVEITSVPR